MRPSTSHRSLFSKFLLFWCLVGGWGMVPPQSARAATYTVTTLDDHDDGACDGGDCTLREALKGAPAGSDITFDAGLAGTITLGSTLTINHNVTVIGPASGITLSGGDAVQVLSVTAGTVTLQNLTLAHGKGTIPGGTGGINVRGGTVLLVLNGCTVSNNTGGQGRRGSIVAGNATSGSRGGAGGLQVRDNARVSLINCTFAQNTGGKGGDAAANSSGDGPLIIAGGPGGTGGIGVLSGTLNITDCTITKNMGGANGLTFPLAPGAGGLFVEGGTVTTTQTIIANNKGATSTLTTQTVTGVADVDGSATSGGYNLIGDGKGSSGFGATDKLNTNPHLGPLQDNGGPTPTLALLAGSPALNAGDPNFDAARTPYDQRGVGYPRVYGGRVDIGAYEAQIDPPATPTPIPTNTPAPTATPVPTNTPVPTATPTPPSVTLSGKVYNAVALVGLPGIVVNAVRQSDAAVFAVGTQNDGTYSLKLQPGTYTLSALLPHKPGFIIYAAFTNPVTLTGTPATLTNYNFRAVGVTGRVISPANVGISGVTLNLYAQTDTALKSPLRTALSDSNGFFSLDGVAAGTYLVAPVSPTTYTYTPATRTVTVVDKAVFTSFTASVKSAPKAVNSPRSVVALSSANADAQAGALILFTGPAEGEEALRRNGDTLALTLPIDILSQGSTVLVSWADVLDTQGFPLQGTVQMPVPSSTQTSRW